MAGKGSGPWQARAVGALFGFILLVVFGGWSVHSTSTSPGAVPGPEIVSLFMRLSSESAKRVPAPCRPLNTRQRAGDLRKCRVCALGSLQDRTKGQAASSGRSGS